MTRAIARFLTLPPFRFSHTDWSIPITPTARRCITFSAFALLCLVCLVVPGCSSSDVLSPPEARPFVSTISFEGGFRVYGYLPVPQEDGFDYYFTPVKVDSSLRGTSVTISSLEVSISGRSNGSVVNWDIEVFGGPSDFGLPVGQFVQTHADPVTSYQRTAPVYARFTEQQVTISKSLSFSAGTLPEMTLGDGLHTQMFFWTADNRNCDITVDTVTLTVRGRIL